MSGVDFLRKEVVASFCTESQMRVLNTVPVFIYSTIKGTKLDATLNTSESYLNKIKLKWVSYDVSVN